MGVKKLVVLVLLFSVLPVVGHASPVCTPDTLAGYIALGAEGCTIGSTLFNDFVLFPTPAGSIPINENAIAVTPIDLPGNPALQFTFATAASGDFFDLAVAFLVTDVAISGLSAEMKDSAVTDDGLVTTIEDYCLGGEFIANPILCSGTIDSLILIDSQFGSTLSDGVTFPAVSTLGVVKDIGIDGTFGTASFGTLTNRFRIGPLTVPEPGTFSSLLLGITALVTRRYFRAR